MIELDEQEENGLPEIARNIRIFWKKSQEEKPQRREEKNDVTLPTTSE